MSAAIDEPLERAKKRIGRIVKGKWHIDALIGMGGMAAVYSATHRNSSRAALKMLRPELSVHEDIRARFLREGYVANIIDHPGTVRVLDDDLDDEGGVFLIMELLEGESLADRLDRLGGRFPVQESLQMVAALLDVLASAHDKGIVHRDLKPDNVFLTKASEVKVLDFGIARVRELSNASSATRTGTMIGTPAFMPPEQALGRVKEIDARTDLWAIGATLFRMITGRNVHPGETANELLVGAATKSAPSLSAVVVSAPPGLVQFLEKTLAFERDQRWPDARTMLAALRQLLASMPAEPFVLEPKEQELGAALARDVPELSSAPTHPFVRKAPPAREHRRRMAMVIGISAALAIVVVVGFVLVRPTGRAIVAEDAGVISLGSAAASGSGAVTAEPEDAAPSTAIALSASANAPAGSRSASGKSKVVPVATPPPTKGKDWLDKRN